MDQFSALQHNFRAYIKFSDKIREFYDFKQKELEQVDLKPSQARLLHYLMDCEGLSQQEISDFFGVRPSTMSEQLSEFEHLGFIYRERKPDNRRMIAVFLTKKGSELATYVYELFEEYCHCCLKEFTPEEVEQFELLLEKFNS